jgi:hypothetical protein
MTREVMNVARPRVLVVDRGRRIVRVADAPAEAVESPQRTLTYPWWDSMLNQTSLEPVAKFAGAPTSLDLDYQVIQGTRAGG